MSDTKYIVVYENTVWVYDEYAKDGSRYQSKELGYITANSVDELRAIIENTDLKNKRYFEVAREVFPKLEVKVSVEV